MTIKSFLMSAATAALLAGTAGAQTTTDDTTMSDDTQAVDQDSGYADATEGKQITSLEEMTVGDVLGMQVFNKNAESIGEIDYVISDGQSASAVIGIGGFLGLGEYTVALPLDEFELNPEEWSLVVDRDKDALKEQPEFDESGAESLPDDTPVADLLMASDEGADSDGAADVETDVETDADSDGGDTDAATDTDADAGDADGADTDAGADAETEGSDSDMSTDGADAETEGDAATDGADAEAGTDAEATTDGADVDADAEVDADADASADTEAETEEEPEVQN
ncbi:PRC-barrel domain-containing protein [Roseovarius sp. SCSIO 43702]|uniref:PRC-barrel domain-containing protein n=1 Tax=Roseovarius sp. SCSIO 43702 TaxID=2823043 RepID=UPI001C735316|nr:PRC-barrel domain-containing protein [Roseovarius sp. SCSIO 43702]QYX56967.1 PRC-barrel domain-containing protein [Roseovarius sp. SCSIO 43702]